MLRHPVPGAARFIDPLCGPASFKMEWSGTQIVRSRLHGLVYSAAQVGSRSSHASSIVATLAGGYKTSVHSSAK